jgi:hypothetical protein
MRDNKRASEPLARRSGEGMERLSIWHIGNMLVFQHAVVHAVRIELILAYLCIPRAKYCAWPAVDFQ